MKKNNLRIKENITMLDKINAIDNIVNYYFTDGEYTPYYADVAKIETIVKYFVKGYKLEDGEYLFECANKDKDMKKLVRQFLYDVADTAVAKKHNKDNKQYIDIMNFVIVNVNEKLEFEKQKRIHCADEKKAFLDSITSFVSDLDKSLGNIANLELSKLTPEMMETASGIIAQLKDKEITPELVSEVVKNAVDFKVPENEIIEGQRKQIGELKRMLQEERAKNEKLKKKNVKDNDKASVNNKKDNVVDFKEVKEK